MIRSASQRCDYELAHDAPDPCVTPAVKKVAPMVARRGRRTIHIVKVGLVSYMPLAF